MITMKYFFILFLALLVNVETGFSQSAVIVMNPKNKGNFYTYWGWNKCGFSKSDIQFLGSDYNFKLQDVVADDRQSKFEFNTYFNPTKFTIPQYNFRVGYYFRESWDISLGIDHMKYVVRQNQNVRISGAIDDDSSQYDAVYVDDDILIEEDFLKFEHTDGLNYVNMEVRHSVSLLDRSRVRLDAIQGIGIGVMIPKTNTTLLKKDRYDEFHISGYGLGGVLAARLTLFDFVFLQPEIKGGFINLPDVRTSMSVVDKAKHSFYYYQYNVVFGCILKL